MHTLHSMSGKANVVDSKDIRCGVIKLLCMPRDSEDLPERKALESFAIRNYAGTDEAKLSEDVAAVAAAEIRRGGGSGGDDDAAGDDAAAAGAKDGSSGHGWRQRPRCRQRRRRAGGSKDGDDNNASSGGASDAGDIRGTTPGIAALPGQG